MYQQQTTKVDNGQHKPQTNEIEIKLSQTYQISIGQG